MQSPIYCVPPTLISRSVSLTGAMGVKVLVKGSKGSNVGLQ